MLEPNITDWRRETFGDLTSVFRFDQPAGRPPLLPGTDEMLALARNNVAILPAPPIPHAKTPVQAAENGKRTRMQSTFPKDASRRQGFHARRILHHFAPIISR